MDHNNKLSVDEQQVEDVTESSNEKKCCTGCHTSKTPLWRGGPAGPKSLCNACGIKYNKKRRQQISTFEKPERKILKPIKRKRDMKLKMRLMVVNKKQPHNVDDHDHDNDVHQPRQPRKRSSYERGKPWWNRLREEEQAAILLMAISCGGSMYS